MQVRNLIISSVLALLTHPVFAATHEVREGESIQQAVNAAQAGDTILVYPGTYVEGVYIDKDGITLRGPDIIAVGSAEESDNCIINRGRYRMIGTSDWSECDFSSTMEKRSYLLADGAPPRSTDDESKARLLYRGICAGCHGYDVRLVGPATVTIQALYGDDAQGIADYIANPVKKRSDYPEMPPQAHLPSELRLEVAEYLLEDGR